jgi:hypothetical protein
MRALEAVRRIRRWLPLAFLLVGACHEVKQVTPPPEQTGECDQGQEIHPLDGAKEYPLAAFPQEPGDRWTYALADTSWGRDFSESKRCLLTVTVTGRETLAVLGPTTVWTLACAGETDTLYLPAREDTLKFYRLTGGVPRWDGTLMPTLVFPLGIGKTWIDSWTHSRVDTTWTVCTPTEGFEALSVVADFSQPNAPAAQVVYFFPGVGIVGMLDNYLFTLGWTGSRRELRLLDYHVGGRS